MEGSAWGRLLSVLIAPARTFAAIGERPTWAVPLVVLTLLGATTVWVTFSRVAPAELMRSVVEESGRNLPPELDAERLHAMSRTAGVVGAAVMGALAYLATAGILLVVLRLAGSEIDFRRSLSVTLHGFAPFALAALLGLPVALGRESISLDELQGGGGLLLSHLGFLAGDDTGKVVHALLTSVDLFSIWTIVLLAIGYSIVGRVSRLAASLGVAAVWGLGVAMKLALAALR